MGVVLSDKGQKRQTSDLTNWINKFKVKKTNLKRQRRKDLFVEAVITYALYRAESELRHKQRLRKQKWQTLKSTWKPSNAQADSHIAPIWDSKTREDLNSIDNFLTEINRIKVPLQR